MITFHCPCGQKLQAADEHAGKTTACPKCGSQIPIPSARSAPPEEDQPAAASSSAVRRRRAEPVEEEEDRPRRRRPRDDDEGGEPERPGKASGTSGKAVFALILGLLSFCVPWLLSIPAILFGILGLSDIGKSQGQLGGRGLAIVGLITGGLTLVLPVLYIPLLLALLLPAVQKVREAAGKLQSSNNLKQMVLAFNNVDAAFNKLPPQTTYDSKGQPLLSWRVYLLPYLGENNLYNQFKLDEPWDGANNIKLLTRMPKCFEDPRGNPADAAKGLTHYQVFIGKSGTTPQPALGNDNLPLQPFLTVFRKSDGSLNRIPDGTSNTFAVVEATVPVPWTKPEDLVYSPVQPLPRLGISGGPFLASRLDGTVRTIDPRTVSEQTIRNAITRDGGELMGPDWEP